MEPRKSRSCDVHPFAMYRDQPAGSPSRSTLSRSRRSGTSIDHDPLTTDAAHEPTSISSTTPVSHQTSDRITIAENPLPRTSSSGTQVSLNYSSQAASEKPAGSEQHIVIDSTKSRHRPTAEAKTDLNTSLDRLKELCKIPDAGSDVGAEIALTLDSLKDIYASSHDSSDSILEEIGGIIKNSRDGVLRVQQGLILVRKAQKQLQSAIDNGVFSNRS